MVVGCQDLAVGATKTGGPVVGMSVGTAVGDKVGLMVVGSMVGDIVGADVGGFVVNIWHIDALLHSITPSSSSFAQIRFLLSLMFKKLRYV